MRKPTKILLTVSAAVLATTLCCCVWTPLESVAVAHVPDLAAPLRTQKEHDVLGKHVPYVIEFEGHGGAALVLGIRHTSDADDPQVAALRRRFREFSPTLVLVEGRLGWHLGSAESLLASFGESGEAVALAHGADVPYASMEPDFPAEVRDAVAAFDAKKTLAFYTLRVFVSERDQGVLSGDLDAEAAALLRKRAGRTGIDALPDLAAFDAFWKDDGIAGIDWRKLPKEMLWRSSSGPWTKRIAERINVFRDRYFVAAIAEAVRRGEKVFAVCGASHAILFEPALRATLR